MTERQRIEQTIRDFVKGGDTRDVELLDRVLHKDFRVTNNGYLGTDGVTIITKETYLDNIKKGIFGGQPRTMEILNLDQYGNIASVKLKMESVENDFVSYNSLVLEKDNTWKIINNLAVVTPKK